MQSDLRTARLVTTPNACYADNVECKMHNLHGPPAKRGKADSMLAMHIRSRVFNLPSQLGGQGGGREEEGGHDLGADR